jgi:hypothetical protein
VELEEGPRLKAEVPYQHTVDQQLSGAEWQREPMTTEAENR